MTVHVWQETTLIPTYGTGDPEPCPMFLENRVYQGSSGAVYPLPIVEKVSDEKQIRPWTALFLENEYLKIMVLPELGGRVQLAYDKVKKRPFVYHNEVIKPALVGLTGPWISGGIEFNWPQHHRPSTYDPVDFSTRENTDGSKSILINEVERMCRTQALVAFTLYPDSAYLEVDVKLFNRTPFTQTFLWWANPAVQVNDHYQSVFPPDVRAVYDHGRRDVSRFPIATGTYNKVDYSSGVDISRYKNIPAPTSYMAMPSKYDFVGGYEHDTEAGMLHVADHHVSPGKKQWTWGAGEFGRAWDKHLTDGNGPYIELMCGVYTDNQPDFSWLAPYEEKAFKQYFMPYHGVGIVKNATKHALVNLEVSETQAVVGVFVTSSYPAARVELRAGGVALLDERVDLSPTGFLRRQVPAATDCVAADYHLAVFSEAGELLVEYRPEPELDIPVPEPAKAAPLPQDIQSVEQLYLQGLHLEQYRHATYRAVDYYREALRREPSDVRSNNALGRWYLRRGRFREAEQHFRAAVATLTERNPNPNDGEPLFNLGLALQLQDKHQEAFDVFYKATWNAAWFCASHYHLAQIACCRSDYRMALSHLQQAGARAVPTRGERALEAALLRKLGRAPHAERVCRAALEQDPFDARLRFELYLVTQDRTELDALRKFARGYVHTFIEYALEYVHAGLFIEASKLLQIYCDDCQQPDAMALYYLAWFRKQSNARPHDVQSALQAATRQSMDHCFPSRVEAVRALQHAIEQSPQDARAWYLLGNYWYANQHSREAGRCWERAVALEPGLAFAHRNLALVRFNRFNEPQAARAALERAVELRPIARLVMELDQLYERLNLSYQRRRALHAKHPAQVEERDDLFLAQVTLSNLSRDPEAALAALLSRRFHPWEGGEGKVAAQYVYARQQLATQALAEARPEQAIFHLQAARRYPDNLGEGKLDATLEADTLFWLGCALFESGNLGDAKAAWQQAAQGDTELGASVFYNDQSPHHLLYQGLSLLKLDRPARAQSRFEALIEYAQQHLADEVKIDYFAVSLPDTLIFGSDPTRRHRLHCRYLMALGYIGLGRRAHAIEALEALLAEDGYHMGAAQHRSLLEDERLARRLNPALLGTALLDSTEVNSGVRAAHEDFEPQIHGRQPLSAKSSVR